MTTIRRAARLPLGVVVLATTLAACGGSGSESQSLRRGDEAFARGDLTEALAEYRLAVAQGSGGPDALMRVGHAYALSGRIDDAAEHYALAVEQDSALADMAAADLLRVARSAMTRNDGVAAAAAVEAAAEIRPGVSPTGISLPLARHFARNARYGQAVSFFQKAARESESDPSVVFEMALAHEEMGDCRRALVFFEQIREEVGVAERSEVDWNIGNCSADLAAEAQAEEDLDEAERLYRATIMIGEPRNRLAEAWFELGEILSERGECNAAVEAYEQVGRQELSGGLLETRARARIDDIRFGRGC